MKTPEEWISHHLETYIGWEAPPPEWIEAIQHDAVGGDAYRKLEMARNANDELVYEIKRLNHNIEVYKERWHQARRYLRQANRGAERNNMIMRLQSADIARLIERIKQLEQQANQ